VTPHVVFPVSDASQVGEARRHAAVLSERCAFDATAAGRLALVVTELGKNLIRHARAGRLVIGAAPAHPGQVEVYSLDEGPGMPDVGSCLADGFSSSGTPGTGLGAVRRLSSSFDIYSRLGSGTLIVARVSSDASERSVPAPVERFAVGALCTAAAHETVSGDGWALVREDDRAGVMVADGLGHGVDAAAASDEALRIFGLQPFAPPSEVLNRAHAALHSYRGAAVAVAVLDAGADTVTFCGAGNIAGRIISGVQDRSLLSQHGTVGLQVRQLKDMEYPWPAHALLVLHSDGIVTRWNFDAMPGLLQRDPGLVAAWLLRDHCRGRDDATVVVVRKH
jgi:anti-sigma regulatory factor (Ser/Thr protein kinase)